MCISNGGCTGGVGSGGGMKNIVSPFSKLLCNMDNVKYHK